MKHLLTAFAALMIVSGPLAKADLLLEPYMGYYFGKTDPGDKATKGYGLGGRVGYSSLGFQVGVDYMLGEWVVEQTGSDFEGSLNNLGIFAAYEFPILLRVFGTYFFDAEFKDTAKYEGKAIRLGVGFSPVPLVDVNLEYVTSTYDELNGSSLTTDLETKMYGISVSIPFEL